MTVNSYLKLFADYRVLMSHWILQSAMQLDGFLYCKIKSLTPSQKYRVSLAREIIMDRDMLFLQEPVLGTDRDSVQPMIQWIESCGDQGKKVITTSQSLKHVYMLPGRHFFVDEEHAEELPGKYFFETRTERALYGGKDLRPGWVIKSCFLIRTRSIILKACREKIICTSDRPGSSVL